MGCVSRSGVSDFSFLFHASAAFLRHIPQSNILERAVDWIFSHLDDLESMEVSEGGRSAAESEGNREPPPGPRVRDGPGSK